MKLCELKEAVDRLVADGHGDVPVVCAPENYQPGYRMHAFEAGLREVKISGVGFLIYNLRPEDELGMVFEVR